ncbi:MAG: MFS transporter [Chitinophagaceae bacterium]|nr:MFS transporter [Chitinophagaceae bacterium]
MKIRHKVLTLLFFLSIIVYLDRVCISVTGKRIKADLGLSNEQFGWVLGAFALSYALFEIPAGILGDKIGPRKVLTRVVLWWSFFTALTGAANGLISLLIIRFLFGAGEAGAYPNSSIVVSRWVPRYETGRAQAFIWAAGRIGGALAPLIVIPIAIAFGWRASFYAMGLIGVIWIAIWYLWYRDTPLQMASVSAKELEEIETNQQLRSKDHRIPWKSFFRNGNILSLMLMFHFFMYGAYFFSAWLPTYLQEGRHFSEDEMKLFATLPFALGAIGCFAGGFLSDYLVRKKGLKYGRRSVGMVSMALSSFIVMIAALTKDNQTAAILLAIGMAFKDFTLPVAFATCIDIGRSRAGLVAGAMNFAGQLGAFFLAVAFGKIVDSTGNYNTPLYFIAAVLFLSSLLWLRINPEQPIVD